MMSDNSDLLQRNIQKRAQWMRTVLEVEGVPRQQADLGNVGGWRRWTGVG